MATRNWLKEHLEEELTATSGKVIKRSGEVVKETPKKTMPKIPASTGVQNKSTLSSSVSLIGRGTAQQNGLSMIPKNNNESINTVKSGIKRALYGGNAAINGVIGTTANAIATPYNAVREVVAEQSTNSLLKNQIEKQKNLLSQIDYLRNYKHKNDEAGLIADPEYQQANKALESYTRVINAVRNNASSNVKDTPFTAAAKNTVAKRNESEQKALEGLGPVGQFLGSTAISGTEGLITLPLAGPFGKSAYMGLQALSALGRKAYDVEAQGGSAKEALTRGAGSALVNYGTSGIGVDRLLGSAKHGMNSVLKNAVVQFPIEGSEEVLEYAGDYVVDKLMGDENAKFEPKEAFLNFLGGGLMGSAFGAGASKIGNYRNKSAADILKEQTLRNNSNLDTVEMPNISQIEKNNIIQRAYNMSSTDKNLLAQKLYNGNYASAKERLFDELTLKYAQGNKNGPNSLPVNGTKLPKMAVELDHEKKPSHLQRPRHTFEDTAKQSAETVSKGSVSNTLDFVNDNGERYIPQYYFNDKTKVISDGDNKKEGLDALILNGLQLPESDTPSDPIFNYSINNTEGVYNGNSRQSLDNNTVIAPGDSFNNDSIGAASYNPNSVREQLDILSEANGAIPEGENAVRYANLPKTDVNGRAVNAYARTMVESDSIQDSTVADIENAVLQGDLSHDIMTDTDALEFASAYINQNGFEKAYKTWEDAFNKGSYDKNTLALAQKLLVETSQAGNREYANKLSAQLAQAFSVTGQNLQAARLLKRMTPEGMIQYAEMELAKVRQQLDLDGKNKKIIDKVNLTEEDTAKIKSLMEEVAGLEDGREKDIKMAQVAKVIEDKIPSTASDKIKALSRISMLFNPKTAFSRNVLGNLTVAPQANISDIIGTAIDKGVARKTGVRTTSLPQASGLKEFKRGIGEAFEDYKLGINTRNIDGNRFEIGQGNAFKGNNPISKALNAVDRTTSFLLDAGDRGFYNAWYENSIKQQLKANKTDTVTPEMIEIARQEALKRTWQDNNKYTKAVSDFRKFFNSLVNIKGYGLGDMFMPFVKTPANLTKAMVDYSPVGVINAVTSKAKALNKAIKTGEGVAMAQRDYVDTLSKGITGTLMMIILGAAAQNGIITDGGDSDKDLADFEKRIMGIMPYSVRIGDKSYTYDWMLPVGGTAAMMADGIAAYNETVSDPNTESTSKILNATLAGVISAGKVLFNQSFAQGVNNLFKDGDIISGAINVISGEPAKFVPTALGQVAQYADGKTRTSYVYNDIVQTSINRAKAKIPGLRNTLPETIDVLGNSAQTNTSAFDVFLNPSNTASNIAGDVANEIYDLYNETGEKSVIPPKAPYYVDYKGERTVFTPQQKEDFQKETGQIISKGIEEMINSDMYEDMTAEDKLDYISELYSYANTKAKEKFVPDYEASSQTAEKIDSLVSDGFTSAQAILFKQTLDNISVANGEKSRAQKDYIQELDLSKKQKEALSEMYVSSSSVPAYTNGAGSASSEGYVLSQMNKSENKAWKILKERGMTLKELERANDVINKKGYSKEQKIAELQLMGYSNKYAHDIWDAFKKD